MIKQTVTQTSNAIAEHDFLDLVVLIKHRIMRGIIVGNVINLKRPLNGKQNVWKYQNGEEKSDSDGREKDV